MSETEQKPKGKPRGRPFAKGKSGNPGGISAEKRDLRKALEGEGETIHEALMGLVAAGNPVAIVYAHKQLVGEPLRSVDMNVSGGLKTDPLAAYPDAELIACLKILKERTCPTPKPDGPPVEKATP